MSQEPIGLGERELRIIEERPRAFEAAEEIRRLGMDKAALLKEARRLRAGLSWFAQTVHQAHHQTHADGCRIGIAGQGCTCGAMGRWQDCRRGMCASAHHLMPDDGAA